MNSKNTKNQKKCAKQVKEVVLDRTQLLEQRRSLPIFSMKQSLMKAVERNSALILLGESGSGKTTQLPQFLVDAGYASKGMVAITQPRPVAAILNSTRVSQEIGCKLGDIVGYTTRFENVTSKKTKIRFITDDSLLQEALSDQLLKRYSAIVLDEVHERTIETDILFGIVKSAQQQRIEKNMNPLKIIVMSATIDVDHFSQYLNNCEIIFINGETFPVKIMHSKLPESDYLYACLATLFEINQNAPVNHDVLMFLTDQTEIEEMVQQIQTLEKNSEFSGPKISVFTLYAKQQQNKLMEAFQPSVPGTRKVILCTNIAESSLTINGIRYVIDCGMVKRRVYDYETGMESIKLERISQEQAWQRTGRVGRNSPGYCYRTYSMADYESMPISCTPEILQNNITNTILQLYSLGINCQTFEFLDKPKPISINKAINDLYQLKAMKLSPGGDSELTEFGQIMAKCPLDYRYSKMVIAASQYQCLEEILSIIAVLLSEQIFIELPTGNKRSTILEAHKRFESPYGDHLTFLNVFRGYQKSGDKQKNWCHENYLNMRNLSYAQEIRNQLLVICEQLKLPIKSCGKNIDQVRKCLITGLDTNLVILHEHETDHQYLTITNRMKVEIHPSSVLIEKPPSKCVLFNEIISDGATKYMSNVTIIEPQWIEPNYTMNVAFENFSI